MTYRSYLLRAGVGLLGTAMSVSVSGLALAQAPGDAQLQGEVQKELDKKEFKDVRATVQNGNVTLQGSVDYYAAKEDADKRVHHVKKVKGVDNEIQVAGAAADDVTLRSKLASALATDRVGYGTTAFNSLTIAVQNGVVTLAGTVYGPPDKDSAISLVEHTPGVKDVVDRIDVAPLSPMDDQLRVALARTIYSTSQLQKYALDPAKPIRITVVNGQVTLTGFVDSKADSDIANLRANGVPGVFKVVNKLQYPGSQSGS